MTPVPLDLPLRPSEAAALAEMIFDQVRNRALTEDIRNRLAGRAQALNLVSIKPFFGSLQPDPIHSSAFYLAVDATGSGVPVPLLLHIAPSAAPATALFPNPLLIGRMRPGGGPEIVINALPFAPDSVATLRVFVDQVAAQFLPRPSGLLPALRVETSAAGTVAPAAFQAFRGILRISGQNLAAFSLPPEPAQFWAVVWAAIRAGFREGYCVTCPCTEETAGLFSRFEAEPRDLMEVAQTLRTARLGRPFDIELRIPDSENDPSGVLSALTVPVQGVQVDLHRPGWQDLCAAVREKGALPCFRVTEAPYDGLLQEARRLSSGRFVLTLPLSEPNPDPVLSAVAAMRG